MTQGPRLIFWEISQRCNLTCPYCRRENLFNDLSLKDSLYIIDSITKSYSPLLIFSGGEPLLYPHLFEVVSYASKKGLTVALATNATLINLSLAREIKSLGFHRVSVSIDGASPETNDSLRGEGTFLKTLEGINYLRAEDIALQINTTVLRRNLKELPLIYKLCLELEIEAWHIFGFVPTGCGRSIPEEERLTQSEYEDLLNEIANLSLQSKIEIKMTCVPHYNRILFKNALNQKTTKGCLAGSSVCFISSEGEVYPCGYLAVSAGNVFKNSFPEIWQGAYLFKTLRNPTYLKGKCRVCEYVDICSGCRARAWAFSGDYLEEEPDCAYLPLNAKY